MCRVWSVTFAIWNPRQLVIWIESSSAPLKCPSISLRARTNARWMAVSGVLPRPRDEWESVIHMKCQPLLRILASNSDTRTPIASAQPLENGSWRRSTPLGNIHPLRRKTVCIFKPAGFAAL